MSIISIAKPVEELKIEIKKSRFLGFAFMVDSEEQAKAKVDELRVQYSDATHVCYAYVCGSVERFSDDGEPHGTAGMPILNLIKGHDFTNVLVVVVRYFGGTKLGAGGLVHAYLDCARAVLDEAGTEYYFRQAVYEVIVKQADMATLLSWAAFAGTKPNILHYGEFVRLEVAVKEGDKLPDYCESVKHLGTVYAKMG